MNQDSFCNFSKFQNRYVGSKDEIYFFFSFSFCFEWRKNLVRVEFWLFRPKNPCQTFPLGTLPFIWKKKNWQNFTEEVSKDPHKFVSPVSNRDTWSSLSSFPSCYTSGWKWKENQKVKLKRDPGMKEVQQIGRILDFFFRNIHNSWLGRTADFLVKLQWLSLGKNRLKDSGLRKKKKKIDIKRVSTPFRRNNCPTHKLEFHHFQRKWNMFIKNYGSRWKDPFAVFLCLSLQKFEGLSHN